MQSRWNDIEAARLTTDLQRRVYTSRLLGAEPDLVLHGGGNTSVKLPGKAGDVLYVKGSGFDLATITEAGFAPVQLAPLHALLRRETLSDNALARELRAATTPEAPAPSVEALLHALIAHKFVDHTHADALVTLMNTPSGEARVRDVYGDDVVIVPYHMPGFRLARACADVLPAALRPGILGVVLLKHGLFTFGETAREAYERAIGLVTRAEHALARTGAWHLGAAPVQHPPATRARTVLARLRADVSRAAGRPLLLSCPEDAEGLAFACRADVADVANRGPATPDHVLFTRHVPLVGRNVAAYAERYRREFDAYAATVRDPPAMLDPAPRVILDAEVGLIGAGRSPREARVARELYQHTLRMISRAERLERWEALGSRELFDMEYWELEQAKLASAGSPPPLAGVSVMVAGAPNGALVEQLLGRGAAVVRVSDQADAARKAPQPACVDLVGNVNDESFLERALTTAARAFGGVDAVLWPPTEGASGLNEVSALLAHASPLLRASPAAAQAALRRELPKLEGVGGYFQLDEARV